MVQVEEPITELVLESPAGLISVRAEVHDGKVRAVTFENVPVFAVLGLGGPTLLRERFCSCSDGIPLTITPQWQGLQLRQGLCVKL